MVSSLRDKVVLITGAGGGFGQEMIRQFLRAGCRLVLTSRQQQKMDQAVAQAIADLNEGAYAEKIFGCIEADLSLPDADDAVYEQCMAITPRIDVLVNNAGIGMHGMIADIPRAKWERLMQVNLLAPMRLTAKFLPAMIERRNGHIVLMSSVVGLVAPPGLSLYSAAKFGMRGFGTALAADVRPHGVAVTLVYPFFARTDILNAEQFGGRGQKYIPDMLIYDPQFVIDEMIKGIETRRLHVYPGALARMLDLTQRFAPWIVAPIARFAPEKRR